MVFLLADSGILSPWGDPAARQELSTGEMKSPEDKFGWLKSAVNEVSVENFGHGFRQFGPVA